MKKLVNTLWVEKYRPDKLDTYVGNEIVKDAVRGYIERNDPPHLLFHGKQGTGKTTLAKIIANNTDSDIMYINASDETGVDVIRDKVKPFAMSVSLSSIKIVIMDEFDFISPNSQAALRNVMEQFSKHTRFILTCNYSQKIIAPIISRCQVFEIIPPSRKEIALHITKILKAEGISFSVDDIILLIDKFYPDMRALINSCQQYSMNNKLDINKASIIESDFKLKLLDALKSNIQKGDLFRVIRQMVADNRINDFTEIFSFLYSKIDDYAPNNIANVILVISEGLRNDVFCVDKEINFMDTMIKLINEKGDRKND